jgi:hypothetical protein
MPSSNELSSPTEESWPTDQLSARNEQNIDSSAADARQEPSGDEIFQVMGPAAHAEGQADWFSRNEIE